MRLSAHPHALGEAQGVEVLKADRSVVDLRNQIGVETWLRQNRPDAIVFAAAKVGGIYANDTFPAESGPDGADDVNGGPGTDTATFAARSDPVQLSLDDQANDGVIGNAQDNIHTDVENLQGGSASDVLSGDAADNAG